MKSYRRDTKATCPETKPKTTQQLDEKYEKVDEVKIQYFQTCIEYFLVEYYRQPNTGQENRSSQYILK